MKPKKTVAETQHVVPLAEIDALREGLVAFNRRLRGALMERRGSWARLSKVSGIAYQRLSWYANEQYEWLPITDMFDLWAVITFQPQPVMPRDPPGELRHSRPSRPYPYRRTS